MTVYVAYASFILFVLLLFLVNAYFLISLNLDKRQDVRVEEKKEQLKAAYKNILEDKQKILASKELLKKSLDRKTNIEAFYYATKEYQAKTSHPEELLALLEETIDINKILKSGIVRKEYKESYALYLLAEFHLGNHQTGIFALSALTHHSLHVRNNALNVINKNKNITFFMDAVEIINSKRFYFNDKTITDFFDNYQGNQNEMHQLIYEKMDTYNLNLRKNIMNHFINVNEDHPAIKDKMLDLLQQTTDKELIISTLRYFNKIVDQRVKADVLKSMESPDWEVRATSARVIRQYPGQDTVQMLKKGLTDVNYFVRYNSAESFLNLVDSELVLKEVIENEDRFARDTLLYFMNTKGLLSLQEYEDLLEENNKNKSREEVIMV